LIQEYGSLGNAINVILGITKPLTEAQKAFNKASYETAGNLAAEEAKVNILTKRLTDSKVPQADRLAAYNELKKIAPDVVSGISRENALTAESNLLIQANSKLRAESVRLKVQEAGITAALTTNETKIAELRAKLEKANAKYVQSAKDLNKVNKDALITGFGSQTAQESALTAFNNNASAVNELQSQIKALSTEIQTYLNQLEPVAAGLAAINDKTFQNIEALKESNKETKQGESDSKKRAAALLREAKALEKKIVAERQARSLRVPLEVSVTIADIGKQDFGKLYKEKIINKFKEAQKASGGIQIPANLPTIDTSKILQSLIDVQNATKERRAAILKEANLQAAADLFKSTFFDPVQNLFTDLLNGADGAFKAFTKAVLQAINQIVAKIIATGIISLLANLISGGTAGLGKAVIGDILGVIGIKKERIGNPNFGGIGAGGMQMSGAVNVVLRGQDLVGALNRTNAQINRVG
jgi:phage-related minor tail protein